MVIEAISNVNLKNNNVSFGKRGSEKPVQNQHSSNPLKAVPLAVLVAMSPLNTTNAENIMRAEHSQNITEVMQYPKTKYALIQQDGGKLQSGVPYAVRALNSKGQYGSFDRVIIDIASNEFEVLSCGDRRINFISHDGSVDKIQSFKELMVEAKYDENGNEVEYPPMSFTDANLIATVEKLLKQRDNKTSIQSNANNITNLFCFKDQNKAYDRAYNESPYYLRSLSLSESIVIMQAATSQFSETKSDWSALDNANSAYTEIKNLRTRIAGNTGNYTVKFYTAKNNNTDNGIEHITIKKDGENSPVMGFEGFFFVTGKYLSLDSPSNQPKYLVKGIEVSSAPGLSDKKNLLICDEALSDKLTNIIYTLNEPILRPVYNSSIRGDLCGDYVSQPQK